MQDDVNITNQHDVVADNPLRERAPNLPDGFSAATELTQTPPQQPAEPPKSSPETPKGDFDSAAANPTTTPETSSEAEAEGLWENATPEEIRRAAEDRTRRLREQGDIAQNPMNALALLFAILFSQFGKDNLEKTIGTEDGNAMLSSISSSFGFELPETHNLFGNFLQYTDTAATVSAGANMRTSAIGNINVGDRQNAVNSVIEKASATAGISPDLLRGVWGIETQFGTHDTLVSGSGCAGDFQFTKTTFDHIIKTHGDKIANALEGQLTGSVEQALRSGNWRTAASNINGGSWGSDLRFHPQISAYASALYLKEVADTVRVDPTQRNNFGVIFAGYNIGPGNAKKLNGELADRSNVASAIGSPARWNPAFFEGGVTGRGALANYQALVDQRISDYQNNFSTAPSTTLANANPGQNPGGLFGGFGRG